jgi:hypothetical protein
LSLRVDHVQGRLLGTSLLRHASVRDFNCNQRRSLRADGVQRSMRMQKQRLLGKRLSWQFRLDASAMHHQDPIRESDDLADLRGNHQNRGPLFHKLADNFERLGFSGDIDPARRLVQDQNP